MTIEFQLVRIDEQTIDFSALFQATSQYWLYEECVTTEELCRA